MARWKHIGVVFLLTLLPCRQSRGLPRIIYSPEEARQVLSHQLSEEELNLLRIPYEANPQIRKLAAEITRRAHNQDQKLASLVRFFRSEGYLDRHQKTGTYTAREVLETGEGNCLSYANLFVAMSRSVGLEAVYLDASRVVREMGRSGSVLVEYGHILVGVNIGPNFITVDFDGSTKEYNRYQVLSDLEAIADFYNNLGYELSYHRREEGGFASGEVVRAFDLATRIAPRFARAYNNLGVAHGRAGRFEDAVLAYQNAIRSDPLLPAPHANLAQIHLRRDQLEKAVRHLEQAVRLDPKNAHYRYFLGKALALSGKLREALEQLQKAVSLDPTLHQAHMWLAQLYFDLQQPDQARQAARRVLELIPGHRDAKRLLADLE